MARTFEQLDDTLMTWIMQQPMFFVATAPGDLDGHVNISPKGDARTFRVLGPTRFAYLDLVGSGVETIAHLRENGYPVTEPKPAVQPGAKIAMVKEGTGGVPFALIQYSAL